MNEYYSGEQLGNYHQKKVRVNFHYFVRIYKTLVKYGKNGEAIMYVTLQEAMYRYLKISLILYLKLL